MVDTEVDKIVIKGLNDSWWTRLIQKQDSENSSQILWNFQEKAAARGTGQFKDLSKATKQPNSIRSALRTRLSIDVISIQTAFQNTEIGNARFQRVVSKISVPQELQEMIESEIRRAAQVKANIQISATAINVVEDSLSPCLQGQ